MSDSINTVAPAARISSTAFINLARVSGLNGRYASFLACAICSDVAVGQAPWNGVLSPSSMKAGTPNLLPSSDPALRYRVYGPACAFDCEPLVSGSSGSSPAITVSARAASATVRAMGPVLSSCQSSGAIPAMLTNPLVGKMPTRLLVATGMRIEFPVSVPFPSTAKLDVTDVTVPPDDPPGEKRASYALPVRPNAVDRFVSLAAKSGMFVTPMMIAPAFRSLLTMVASFGATSS